MENREYYLMYKTEENHWWFKGKRKIIFSQLENYLKRKELKILDLGCGTGIITKNLKKYGDVKATDIKLVALNLCKRRGINNLVQSSVTAIPFKSDSFDVVTMFDVLYHKGVNSDVKALREAFRVLKPGGMLVLTDSANMRLKSSHDIATHARERYTIKKLSSRLKISGFDILRISYYNSILFPFVFIVRKLKNMINKNKVVVSDIKNTNPLLNYILYAIFSVESKLLKIFNLPFGVSLFVIAKKPLQ